APGAWTPHSQSAWHLPLGRSFTSRRETHFAAASDHIYRFLEARTQSTPCSGGENRPTPMLNEVYNRRILELAGGIPRLGRLPAPDASATAHSKLCGSTVTVDLKM